ncbi:GT-D fold domain-containing glycosyltransferase [uncultured Megasphaera sp.]|uniref:GT-D fold domain-containing glycosyltransferase n=1 Tax=uncultured Megasphaera sp. TaxID=165188 RepID=UPI0025D6C5E7|nr:GT-D fold domain-containing glycosyltransferase [uncultured Megasphaera sp.]
MFLLSRLKNACLNLYCRHKNAQDVAKGVWQPQIMSLEDTLNDILEKKLSIARFGDGEFKWMMGIKQQSFQEDNEQMKQLLNTTFSLRDERLLICIPDAFGDLSKYNTYAVNYWSREMWVRRQKIRKLMGEESHVFGNSYVTRFYMDYINKDHVENVISLWRKIFGGRRIYIIEGEFSRLGVGNDLFSTAKSVQRILAPAKNAFNSYQKILSFVKNHVPLQDQPLILLALGPTATIMVPFLMEMGYQALDVGHIDVEYEWYKLKATKKIPLLGRYVNEAGGFKSEFPAEILQQYENEIIARIDC